MKEDNSDQKVIIVSLLVNLTDIVINLVVALITGSATIFSEMAKGIADSLGSIFLVIGQKRSQKRKDQDHPLGYSREAFFWSLMSAFVMLVIGGGLSLWRGVNQLIHPEPLESPYLAMIVIIIAVFTNGYAVSLSARKLKEEFGSLKVIFSYYHHPLVKGAFLRDLIGTTTSVFGLFAIFAYQIWDMPLFDALGAIISSVLMTGSSLFLIIQARALITGQTLPKESIEELKEIILRVGKIEDINSLVAIYSGANEILLDADLDMDEQLSTLEIEEILDVIEDSIKEAFPNINRVRVLLNSPQKK